MSKLICEFENFQTRAINIKNLINTYRSSLTRASLKAEQTNNYWISDAQKMYCNKFLERKAEMDTLGNYLDNIESFLNEVVSTYQKIESNYSGSGAE